MSKTKFHKREAITCPGCKAVFCRMPGRRGRPALFCTPLCKRDHFNAQRPTAAERKAEREDQALPPLPFPNPGDYVDDESYEAALAAWHDREAEIQRERNRPEWWGLDFSNNGARHSSGARRHNLSEGGTSNPRASSPWGDDLSDGFLSDDWEAETNTFSDTPGMAERYKAEGIPADDDEGRTADRPVRVIGQESLHWDWQNNGCKPAYS